MAENPMTEEEHQRMRRYIKPFTRINVLVYRLSGGRLMRTLQGREVCLVTMTGAKSGRKRTIALMYVPYQQGVIIVASLGGAPKSPIWARNLVANPDIEVQYRNRKMKLRARQVGAEEKARVWPTAVEHYPPFEDYQRRTDRDIPVFVCEPRA